MYLTIHKWVWNVIPVTNPTQYTQLGKYKVKTKKTKFTPNTPKYQKSTICRIFCEKGNLDPIDEQNKKAPEGKSRLQGPRREQ